MRLRCRRSKDCREFGSGLGHPATGKLYQPSRKWAPVSNQGGVKQRKEKDELRLSLFVP